MNALPGAGVDSGVCEETPQDLALLHPRDLLGFLRRREIELADRLSNLGIEPVADHPELLDPKDYIVEEQLTLAPLPCWRSLEPAAYRARVQSLIEEIEAWGRQRQEETGEPPLGREKVCRQDPHLEPNRINRAPAPLVHAVAPEVRRALRRPYFSFLAAYQQAARLLRAGVREVDFPEGAFPPAFPARFAARSG